MTKSAKHKKLRKAKDKVKQQLPSGIRKLSSKPTNIINPKFKAKKIVIRDQELRSGGTNSSEGQGQQQQPTTIRCQSLGDLLSTVNHHNTNIKQEGLHGLQELITSQPQILIGNLDSIVEKLGKLSSDIEGSVRRTNLKVSESIFALITEDQLSPFWNLLLTHIQCTLTNLDSSVRYSALGFIRLLISYFPNLISNSIETILSNLLLLISTTKNPTTPTSSSSTTSATSYSGKKSPNSSTSNSNSSSTKLKTEIKDSKERINVLSLISTCLDLHNSKYETKAKKEKLNANASSEIISSARETTTGTGNGPQQQHQTHVELYSSFRGYQETSSLNYANPLLLNHSDASSSSWTKDYEHGGDDPSKFWPQFTESCISILCEIWLEIRPSNSTNNDGGETSIAQGSNTRGICNLSKSSIESLETIVMVLSRLLNIPLFIQDENWKSSDNTNDEELNFNICRRLRKNYGQKLRKYFFHLLPFSSVLDTMKRQITNLNLDLFLIAAKLRLVDAELMSKFKNYVCLLTDKFLLDSAQTQQVFQILSLLHLTDAGHVITIVLNYGIQSGYHESIHAFLSNALLSSGGEETDKKNILSSIDWNEIIPILIDETGELTNDFISLLTSIALKNILELRKLLDDNMDKFKQFLETRKNSIPAWDQINRLFYYSGNLDLLTSCGLDIPQVVKSTIDAL